MVACKLQIGRENEGLAGKRQAEFISPEAKVALSAEGKVCYNKEK